VTLAVTGEHTATGGRLKRVAPYIKHATFMATYGDGVANVDLDRLLECHRRGGKLATITAVRPSSRYGELRFDKETVTLFQEKPQVHEGWINGGFFVFEPEVLDWIEGDDESLEVGLLTKLANHRQLAVYRHDGFWQCMDTYREMQSLNTMWKRGAAPWAIWR